MYLREMKAFLAGLVGVALRLCIHVLTLSWHILRGTLALASQDIDRAPYRLRRNPTLLSEGPGGNILGLDQLPQPPALPANVRSIEIAGCANLCMYTAGACFALQRAETCKRRITAGEVVVRGGSSGSFVAAALVTGSDCAELMRLCRVRFATHRRRFGGCIGIFSSSVHSILKQLFEQTQHIAETDEKPSILPDGQLLRGFKLEVSLTQFLPMPTHTMETEFHDTSQLLNTVLASCYIPIAYEWPIVLPGRGFCVDGCALRFLPNADCVVSPYHCHTADVTPTSEYPRAMVFNLLHPDDVLTLFEDGYMDAVRWLEAGGSSRTTEREKLQRNPTSASLRALWSEGWRVFQEMCAMR